MPLKSTGVGVRNGVGGRLASPVLVEEIATCTVASIFGGGELPHEFNSKLDNIRRVKRCLVIMFAFFQQQSRPTIKILCM
jgi:hypothetical protein